MTGQSKMPVGMRARIEGVEEVVTEDIKSLRRNGRWMRMRKGRKTQHKKAMEDGTEASVAEDVVEEVVVGAFPRIIRIARKLPSATRHW